MPALQDWPGRTHGKTLGPSSRTAKQGHFARAWDVSPSPI